MEDRSEEARLSEALIRTFMQFGRLRMEEAMKNHMDHQPHSVKRSEMMLLMTLNYKENEYADGISVSDISHLLRVKPPSVTTVIADLEQKELIERTMDTSDRRIVRVKMTDTGRKFIKRHKNCMVRRLEGLVDYLGTEKSATLVELMNEAYQYFKIQGQEP